ncbi:MAG: hypothetical protein ABIJ34_05365 [archaeon]
MKSEDIKHMKADELRFRIDQLRKDKMIYALESIAFTFIAELGYFLIAVITLQQYSFLLAFLALIPPTVYFLFMVVGNFSRLKEIKKLELELYKK